jgi:ubiquinone/menaquinone biosynthesis C-methylase UbiE
LNVDIAELPAPSVPPDVYDEAYYREWCAGFAEWVASAGRTVAGIYPGVLRRAGLRPGEVVVDMGTGRGELPVTAVGMGAAHAYGVEYSPDAVALAEQTLEVHGAEDHVEILLCDARAVPLPDAVADLVCFVDVVEHVTPAELRAALLEARRLLRPGGRVVVHTAPNRLTYDVTYRLLQATVGRRWPRDPRNHHERLMHVNEQTTRSLRRSLEAAGFRARVELGEWVRDEHPPSAAVRRLYRVGARLGPVAQLTVSDIWGFGTAAPAGR